MKTCTRCGEEKPNTNEYFHKAKESRLRAECKECLRKYAADNAQAARDRAKEYYKNNTDKVKAKNDICRKANPEKYRKTRREYVAKKRKTDNSYRLLAALRSRLTKFVKGDSKSKTTVELLGCSLEYLKAHLETRFTTGMTWDNYGEWHVDHIKPCAGFDLTDMAQQKTCFHYTNLQPLWAVDNLRKGTR